MISGLAAATILSAVDSQAIDLIVLCSHGSTGMKRWALGSVAEKVTHHAKVPVLLLREGGLAFSRSHQHEGTLCVLIPLDGSPYAQTAIIPAAQLITVLSSPAQGMLHVTQVVTSLDAVGIGWRERATMVQEAKENLSATVKSIQEEPAARPIPHLKLPITWLVTLDDDVASDIMRVAENGEDAEGAGVFGGCDMIALATHARGAMRRWLMGSITERVLHATKLPLFIVRPSNIADNTGVQ